jgi:N-acetylglucosaminyl-diphospho-decaprenol L-rhamnosyltransferase
MLSVVIVNWNGGEIIERTLSALIIQAKELKNWLEIIVVDNASSDNSVDYLDGLTDSVRIIKSNVNLGFAGGCNLGAVHATMPYLLFLNPDTEVSSETLRRSVEYINSEDNKKVGIVGVQLVDQNGQVARSSARFPRAFMFLAQNLGLDRLFPILGHSMNEWRHDETREVDQVIGAYFLTKRNLFEQLNGFDERFFVYFEEVDYAYRAYVIGYMSVYLADVSAFHEGEGTTSQVKGKRIFYLLRSRLLYGRKHYGFFENLLNFANTLFLEPVARAAFMIASGRASELPALREGFTLIYNDLPNIFFRKMRP